MFAGMLPSYFTASTTQVIVDLITALSQPITLILGILAGTIILEVILTSHRK